jgi:hypothetical protein
VKARGHGSSVMWEVEDGWSFRHAGCWWNTTFGYGGGACQHGQCRANPVEGRRCAPLRGKVLPVFDARDDDARTCRSPPWRRRRGASASLSISLGAGSCI